MQVIHGDSYEEVAKIPENSIDSIVCDPPYMIGFMGKAFDHPEDNIAGDPEFWKLCLRVLKPGGHLLAFGGSRTYHRLASGIEDAGFEIRDQIMWVYGSGFPKSLDISKAIDKQDAVIERNERSLKFTKWMRETRITPEKIVEITGKQSNGNHLLASNLNNANIAVEEDFSGIREYLKANSISVPSWVEDLVAERTVESKNYKKRGGVVKRSGTSGSLSGERVNVIDHGRSVTKKAKQWQGWGTALKPAHEPIVVARKPLIGTVAENVLTHGTGGLNLDGCRVGTEEITQTRTQMKTWREKEGRSDIPESADNSQTTTQGRWPANLIHDGSEEVLECFPNETHRFFYSPKASKKDRDEGLEGFEEKQAVGGGGGIGDYLEDVNSASGKFGSEKAPAKNNHPTVKPTALMRYLVKLVTPPGGTVLDPFMGSGSTGKACKLEGFDFIGIEREEEYVKIAEARIEGTKLPQPTLI